MGIRTPGLVIANDALYQLSYTPEVLLFNELRCKFRLGNWTCIPQREVDRGSSASFARVDERQHRNSSRHGYYDFVKVCGK